MRDNFKTFLVLFALMLLPNMAWAQTLYNIEVEKNGVSYQINSSNYSNVLNDDGGTVTYDDGTSTLTLNGASLSKITSGLEALTIVVNGESAVGYIDTNTAINVDKTLTISKGSEFSSSLYLYDDQGHSVIEGFKSVSLNGFYAESDIPCVYSTSNKRYETADAAILGTLAFTTTQRYPLWVTRMQSSGSDTYQVSDDNKTHILGTGITSVQFDGTNTLTLLANEEIVYVTSGLDALTIAINGSCQLSSFNKNDDTPAITSVNPDASLTIALAEGATSGDLALRSAQGKAISGFKSLTHTGLLNLTDGASYSTENLQWSDKEAAFASELKKPTIEINYGSKYFKVKNPNAGGYGGSLRRKTVRMTSVGKVEDDEESIADGNSQDYNNNVAIWKYWVKANDYDSDPIYVCRLGLEDVEVTYGDTSIPTPSMLPESIDGVSLSYSTEGYSSDVAEVVNGAITIKSTGRQPIDAAFSNIPTDYTFLTDVENGTPKATYSLMVKPQKPTLSLAAGTYVGAQTVEVGNISPGATAKYYTYEGTTAPANPSVSVVPDNNKIEIASSKTLVVYSETEYDLGDNNGYGYLTSETESATYTIRINISDFTVLNKEATAAFEATATYTGSAIVPEFTVEDKKGTSLTAGTDYTVSYKKVGEGDVLTDETTMEDVGYYKIVITGAGNYGGSITVDFEITQADAGLKFYKEEDGKVVQVTTASATYGTAFEAPSLDNPQNLSITYRSKINNDIDGEDSEVATIDATTGVITINRPGEAYIFASTTGNDNYAAATVSYTLTVNKGSLGSVTIAPIADQEYTGSEITPDLEVTTPDGTAIDVSTGDYDILYDNNISAGEATITVAAKNSNEYFYERPSKQATFTITQLDISNATVTLDNTTLIYNGSVQTVNVTTVSVGDIEVPIDCYEVSGNTGTEIGDYTLTVTAKTMDSSGNPIKNNFTGSAEKDWKIKYRTVTADELGLSDNQTYATYFNNTENLELPDGIVAYIITGVSGTTVTTKRISYIPKDVAVLVESGTSTEDAVDVATDNQLQGTAAAKDVSTITGGAVYVLYKSEFVKTTTGTIPANRCYLVVSGGAGARSLSISHGEGNGTGIKDVMLEEDGTEKWYDLQGRRINQPTKPGLYILNGKKTTIKKQ